MCQIMVRGWTGGNSSALRKGSCSRGAPTLMVEGRNLAVLSFRPRIAIVWFEPQPVISEVSRYPLQNKDAVLVDAKEAEVTCRTKIQRRRS